MAKNSKKSSLKPKLQKAKAKFFSTYYSNPAKDLKIIVVTGDLGRDIVAHYLQEIIKHKDPKVGLIIDPQTTSQLYKELYQVWRTGTDYAVVTAQAYAIARHLFYGMPIYAAVLTDSQPEQSSVMTPEISAADAKAILFNKEPVFSILNREDPNYETFAQFPAKTATLTYGRDRDADLRINRSKVYKVGTEANITFKNESYDVATYVTSEIAVNFMAAAALTASAMDFSQDFIVDGISNYEPKA